MGNHALNVSKITSAKIVLVFASYTKVK